MRALDKYLFHSRPVTVLVASALGAGVFFLVRNLRSILAACPSRWVRAAVSPAAFALLGLLLAAVSLAIYPRADGLKAVGRGTDADDSMILGATNLVRHFDPYRSTTYFGNPISPGPGWVLLASPFSLTGLWALFFPLSVAVLYFVARASGADLEAAAGGAIVLVSGLGIWEMMVQGGDLFPLGVGVALCLFALRDGGPRGRRFWVFVGLLALLSTARLVVPFLLLPPVFLYLLRSRGRLVAMRFLAGTTLATLGIHVVFYLRAADYMPLHLVAKGLQILEGLPAWTLVVVAAGLGAGAYGLRRRLAELDHERLVLLTATAFAVPLLVVAVADLSVRGFDLADWEGSNYAAVAVPSCLYGYLLAGVPTRIESEPGSTSRNPQERRTKRALPFCRT